MDTPCWLALRQAAQGQLRGGPHTRLLRRPSTRGYHRGRRGAEAGDRVARAWTGRQELLAVNFFFDTNAERLA